jgi:carbon monoxide dehydrogenase subunit G
MKTSVDIARPPEAVWPWLTEFEKKEQWLKGLLSEDWYEGEQGAKGSKFKVKIKEGPSVSEYDGEVLDIEKFKRIHSSMTGGCGREPMTMEVEYNLTDTGGGTRLDYEGRCVMETKGVMKLFMPLFTLFGKMQANSFHKNLKKLAEA